MLSAVIALLLAALLGGMLLFSALLAPLVFTQLPAEVAGRFIRAVFPWYYLWVAGFAALAAAGLAVDGRGAQAIGLAVAVALSAAWTRWRLMPSINALRDRQLAGDAAAGQAFERRHRLSVAINALQLLAAGWLVATA